MTVGMIFECGPQGADKQICSYLAGHIRPDIPLSFTTLDNKENLLSDAGRVAAQMLADGCCCVIIIWDLRPAWPSKNGKPCRNAERQTVLTSLQHAGVPVHAPVHLVCVEQELESWLLANESAIAAFLSTNAHPYSVKRTKKPDRVLQPKAVMNNHFKAARGWRYDDKVNAIQVLRSAPINLGRHRQSASFVRFEQKLLRC